MNLSRVFVVVVNELPFNDLRLCTEFAKIDGAHASLAHIIGNLFMKFGFFSLYGIAISFLKFYLYSVSIFFNCRKNVWLVAFLLNGFVRFKFLLV